jgi:UDP-GlcNAc:undecaprenyl-phosphate/decaprenyl-phosphate GlcNAc-1-phosphate transferase
MRTAIISFFVSAMVCAALVPLVRRFAIRRNLFDQATNSRKLHTAVVPRLGGVAIIAGFYAPLVALLLYPTGVGSAFYAQPSRAFAFIVGGIAIGALGLFDDLFGAGAKGKFSVQIAVAAYIWCAGFRIEQIQLPSGGVLPLGIFGFALTVVWIVGVMNAMNLIDGMDGLAAGIALSAATVGFIVATAGGEPLMALCMASVAGALVAFLFFNSNPASIFMGDSGSLFLGYVLAVSALRSHQKSSAAVSLLVPIVALALPIADTLLAMLRRGIRGRPIFSGDKEHIHHRLFALGLSHRKSVLVLHAVSVLLGLGSLALVFLAPQVALTVLAGLVVTGLLALWRLGFFPLDFTSKLVDERHRNAALRRTVKTITAQLRRATSIHDVLGSVGVLGPAIEANRVRLDIRGARSDIHGDFTVTPWHVPRLIDAVSGPKVQARFPLEPGIGHLEIEWTDGRDEIDRDHEIAAETLCKAITRALERTLSSTAPALPGGLKPASVPTTADVGPARSA